MTGQGRGNKITTDNMEAIERIKGFCCEVTQEQWEELVRVADDNGVNPSADDEWDEFYPVFFIDTEKNEVDAHLSVKSAQNHWRALRHTPFPDFLAKLRGEEKWEPKNGEEVEVKPTNRDWTKANYVGMDGEYYVCLTKYDEIVYHGFKATRIRPARPTITRAEAESLLNKRIID